jgi:hypothetical protein
LEEDCRWQNSALLHPNKNDADKDEEPIKIPQDSIQLLKRLLEIRTRRVQTRAEKKQKWQAPVALI